jgi:hypothetical protein
VTDAIEGRWLLEMGRPPTDPAENEFALAGGQVALAATGEAIGHYEVQPGQLTITLAMPTILEEGPQRMIARLLLPEPVERVDRLPGVIEAILPGGATGLVGSCFLARRNADA